MLSILDTPALAQQIESWFWQRLDRSGECWIWTYRRNDYGYGRFTTRAIDGRKHELMAHRTAYELAYGPIADGLQVLHRCDNPPCCNPAHLFLGTIKENIHDAMAKGRFTCGVRQHNSKLTDTQVQRLRQQRALGASVQQLATQYQLSPQNVRMIVRRRTWKHVP